MLHLPANFQILHRRTERDNNIKLKQWYQTHIQNGHKWVNKSLLQYKMFAVLYFYMQAAVGKWKDKWSNNQLVQIFETQHI